MGTEEDQEVMTEAELNMPVATDIIRNPGSPGWGINCPRCGCWITREAGATHVSWHNAS